MSHFPRSIAKVEKSLVRAQSGPHGGLLKNLLAQCWHAIAEL